MAHEITPESPAKRDHPVFRKGSFSFWINPNTGKRQTVAVTYRCFPHLNRTTLGFSYCDNKDDLPTPEKALGMGGIITLHNVQLDNGKHAYGYGAANKSNQRVSRLTINRAVREQLSDTGVSRADRKAIKREIKDYLNLTGRYSLI